MNRSTDLGRILVVDDEPDLLTVYELTLLRAGYQVQTAASVAAAKPLLTSFQPDLLMTDMRLPDGLGLDLLVELRQRGGGTRALVVTAYGSTQNAVDALRAGAFDYLTKPVDPTQLRRAVAAALASRAPEDKHIDAAHMGISTGGEQALARLVGSSPAMQAIHQRIRKVAPSMAPVLIQGESGTGKELVAYAIHANSHRARGPWVAVNCGAIPEHLLESEFFGTRKGAYTGAQADRPGYFQAAHGGTLFLDEIGELPMALQPKLLRAIQERQVRPLGATQEEPVDVRIISATHRDLRTDVAAGRFRQDLYYRLNVIELLVPPLRDRRDDLPALCATLLERIAQTDRQATPNLDDRVLRDLMQRELPGNVRELENLLYRAITLGTDALISGDPAAPPPEPETPIDLQSQLDAFERRILLETLAQTHFNRTAAAQLLGLNLRQMRYRIERLGIKVPETATDPPEA